MNLKMTTLALLTLAGTAFAQPATFTDLGNRTTTQTFTQDVTLLAANDIQWFRIVLPPVTTTVGWVDIWTSAPGDIVDSEIGLYTSAGVGAGTATTYFDDDSGAGNLSQLTFGSTVARPLIPGSAARNGSDGVLGGGEHYLAVGRFNVTFVNSAFNVTSTYALAERTTTLNFDISAPTDPTPILVTANVTPSTTSTTTGLLTATVSPGFNPPSSGVVVTADLTSIGGSATAAMFDDGTNGDLVAGNGVYSRSFNLPAAGTYPMTVNAGDAQSRTATDSISFLYKDAGTVTGTDTDLTTIDVITVSMPTSVTNIAWMKFELSADVANDGDNATIGVFLDIDTEGTGVDASVAGTLSDTEIGLYQADGTFLDFDDDDGSFFHSMLSYGDVAPARTAQGPVGNLGLTGNGRDGGLTAGTYWLAIGNFNVEFPAAVAFGATTANTTAAEGEFVVNFRTNLPGETRGACSEADIGIAGGLPGQDNLLDNNDFIAFINYFFALNPIADMGIAGGLPGADGQWDNNDFIAFINHFFADGANCNG